MKRRFLRLIPTLLVASWPFGAQAQQKLDEYIAVIGPQDRVNSSGVALTRPEQILAQDRANFHRFGRRDAGDTSDTLFATRENRAALADLVSRGHFDRAARQAILSGANTVVRVEVFGNNGQPLGVQVTLADQHQQSADQTASTAQSNTTTSALPTFGTTATSWKFSADAHNWRGTAFVEGQGGWQVALGCTRPGAEPARYPGGSYVRPHEPGVYNLFVSPTALGGDFGASGAQTFTMSFSVDQQSFGTAPMIVLSPEMSLATNIPVDHPMISAMQSGSSLQVLSPSNGAALTASLAGSSEAIMALSSFCASPVELEQNVVQSTEQQRNNQTIQQPSAPTLEVAENYARGEQIVVKFSDPAPGSRPWITIVKEGAAGAAYGQYHYTNGQTSGEFTFSALQTGSYEVRFHASETSTAPVSIAKIAVGPAIGATTAQQGPVAQTGAAISSAELACEIRREDEKTAQYICRAADGGRLTNDQYREAYAQIALRNLGCDVPVINGDISTSQEAMACFRTLVTPPADFNEMIQLIDLSHYHKHKAKDDLIAALVARGYTVVEDEAPAVVTAKLPLDATPAVRATLNLPDPEDGMFYVSPGYYHSDFSVPLSAAKIEDMNTVYNNGERALLYYLENNGSFLTPLFYNKPVSFEEMMVSLEANPIWAIWYIELLCDQDGYYPDRDRKCANISKELFPRHISSALTANANVHMCEYDRMGGTSIKPDLNAGGGSIWIKPTLAFWAQPMPEVLSADNLKDFPSSKAGMHPLLAIGPYLEACPSTLGEAAEYLAGRFTELVPLAAAQPAVAVDQSGNAAVSLDQGLAKQMLGLTLNETTVEPNGEDYGRNLLVISTLDESGPAYKSGLRSGDYISAIGWTQPESIAAFLRELNRSVDNGAVSLGVRLPGTSGQEAAYFLPFSQSDLKDFRAIARDTTSEEDRPGWTTLASNVETGRSVRVRGTPWCAETVEGEYALRLRADGLVDIKTRVFREGIDAIFAQCPEAKHVNLTSISTLLNAKINMFEVKASDGKVQICRRPLDGLARTDLNEDLIMINPVCGKNLAASTVAEAREIAARQAPLCDRLTAHPSDPERRFGLEGVEFMLPDTLEQAVTACLEELEKNPEVPVVNFQIGRALYEASLFEEAAGFLEVAAASGHGGAADYLGQMHADGTGVVQDFDLSDSYFVQAQEAGFDPFGKSEKVSFDTTGVTVPWTVEYLYQLSFRLMPSCAMRDGCPNENNPDTLRYFFHITKEIAESCTDEGTLNRLYEELEKEGADIDQLEHAIFMYESYLPNLLPIMAQRVNQTMDDFQEGGSSSGFALTGRYDCQSSQLRQLALNAATLIVR